MSTTDLVALADQVATQWSPLLMQELRENYPLPAIVSKRYSGEVKAGQTVKVSQINAPSSELRTIGENGDSYSANVMSTSSVDLTINKRAVSAFVFDDLTDIMTILSPMSNPEVRQALMHDIGNQISDYLYSLIVPSTSAPDHLLGGTAAMSNTIMANMRELAAAAKWPKSETWYHLMGVNYYSDFLAADTLVADTFGFNDAARVNGQIVQNRYGFSNIEDNSVALATSSVALVPSAILYAQSYEPRFKISDNHSSGSFGYSLSVDIPFGATLSIDGNKKCIKVTAAS